MARSVPLRVIAVIVLAIGAMWLVIVKTGSNFYYGKRPDLAAALDPGNNFALSKLAASVIVAPNQQALDLKAADRFAEKAIRLAPRDSTSLAVLAFGADAGEYKADSFALASKAQAYSKRSLLAQIYLIEHYAKLGDVPRTLYFYNLALTTRPSSQRLLLPRLYTALGSPEVRRELLALLGTGPAWKKDFWLGLTDLHPFPPSALQFVEEARPHPAAVPPGIAPRLVQALASDRRFAEARRIAEWGGAGASVVTGPHRLDRLVKADPVPPLDWAYKSSGSHSAQPSDDGLLLSVRGSKDVEFATRLLFLPPGGAFDISARLRSDDGEGHVGLSMRCATSNRTIFATSASVADLGETVIELRRFAIPAECPQQWLSITGGSAAMRSADLALSDFAIRQARQ
jgi:hypothetical protein